jgi:hypothetical protein
MLPDWQAIDNKADAGEMSQNNEPTQEFDDSSKNGERGESEVLLFQDPREFRKDLAIVQRLIRERWDIPARYLVEIPRRIGKIIDNAGAEDKDVIRASEAMLKMKAQNDGNMHKMPTVALHRHHHEHTHVDTDQRGRLAAIDALARRVLAGELSEGDGQSDAGDLAGGDASEGNGAAGS